jgi:1,4-dihydroxy-2-naphthoate octaprenyltransferase
VTSLSISAFAVVFQIAPMMLLFIMIGANFLGWFYSAPPLRLVSRGLGGVAIALAVGFVIPAAGYLSSKGAIDSWYGLFVVPFILYGFMLALSLEAPDVEGDRLGDKKTLGVTKGAGAVFTVAFSVSFASFLIFLCFAFQTVISPVDISVITAFSSIPLAAGLLGLLQILKGKNAQIPSAINVVSLFTINLLIIVYLTAMLCL